MKRRRESCDIEDYNNQQSQETQIEAASRDGKLDLLQCLCDQFLELHQTLWWEVSENAVAHLDVLKWIYQRDRKVSPHIWEYMHKYGSVESAEWLTQQQDDQLPKPNETYALSEASKNENFEMLFWCIKKDISTLGSFNAVLEIRPSFLLTILECARASSLQELIVRYPDCTNDILRSVKKIILTSPNFLDTTCRDRRKHMVRWLVDNHLPISSTWMVEVDDICVWQDFYSKRALMTSKEDAHVIAYYFEKIREQQQQSLNACQENLYWLLDRGYVISSTVWSNLAFYCDIKKMDWLYEICKARNLRVTLDWECYRSPITSYRYREKKGRFITLSQVFEVMNWLFTHDCHLNNSEICNEIAKIGELTLLQWVKSRGAPWSEEVCEIAAYNGHLELLRWVIDNGCPYGDLTIHNAISSLPVLKYLVEEKQCSIPQPIMNSRYCHFAIPSPEAFLWALERRPEFWTYGDCLLYSSCFFYRETDSSDMMHAQVWQVLQLALRNRLVDPIKIAQRIVRNFEYVCKVLKDYQTNGWYSSKLLPNKRWQMIATLTDLLNRMATMYELGFLKQDFTEQLLYVESARQNRKWDWQLIKKATDEVHCFNAQSIRSRQCRLDSFYERMFYPFQLFLNSWQDRRLLQHKLGAKIK